MMIWYVFGFMALGLLAWLGNGIRRIGAVSRGEPIGTRENAALLLIDLQAVFWSPDVYSEADRARAEAAILAEVARAKAEGSQVIAVRQEWSIPSTKALAKLAMKGQAIAGTRGTELAAPFAEVADHVVVKRVQDAFETGALDLLLAELDVGRLTIAGLDTNFCVAKTALAACGRGYEVCLVEQGVLAADLKAAQATLARLAARGVALV